MVWHVTILVSHFQYEQINHVEQLHHQYEFPSNESFYEAINGLYIHWILWEPGVYNFTRSTNWPHYCYVYSLTLLSFRLYQNRPMSRYMQKITLVHLLFIALNVISIFCSDSLHYLHSHWLHGWFGLASVTFQSAIKLPMHNHIIIQCNKVEMAD